MNRPDDLENGQKGSRSSNAIAFLQAGALLTIWSLLVINEGAIRVMDQSPSIDLLGSGRPPKLVPFLGGLFEVSFGLFGFFVGAAALLLKRYSTLITKLCMGFQSVLGYYVFIVFVFLLPIYQAIDIEPDGPVIIGISAGERRFIITMGILTSSHFCLALQGGQFVFMARLVSAATGENFLGQKKGNKMRAYFWNGNMILSGLWTLITGAVVHAKFGGGRLLRPVVSPPNVVVLPGMTIFTGLLLIVWGLVGIAMTMSGNVPTAFFAGTAVVYFMGLLNYGIAQFGLLPAPPAGAVALHNGLVFMVVFMGAYFVHAAANESKDDADSL